MKYIFYEFIVILNFLYEKTIIESIKLESIKEEKTSTSKPRKHQQKTESDD